MKFVLFLKLCLALVIELLAILYSYHAATPLGVRSAVHYMLHVRHNGLLCLMDERPKRSIIKLVDDPKRPSDVQLNDKTERSSPFPISSFILLTRL